MMLVQCGTPAEITVATCMQEWSRKEHHGIKNVLVLALTNNDECILGAMNFSNITEMDQMLSYAAGAILGKEALIDNAIREFLERDDIPEDETDERASFTD